ncbi:MAG: peptidoglycan DD-metalloendopeptidase family protein [Saprospiraceae bacterium]|nr:peptidoglycan DD-metalloendopeptidase family protein [Saprospiraceae bacterium]
MFRNLFDSKSLRITSGCKTLLLLLVLPLLLPLSVSAQSKKELEAKRKKLIKDIEVTGKLLQKTTQTKEATYDRFVALQNQIEYRENLIATLDEEAREAEDGIARASAVINSLTRDVNAMQDEYGRMVRNAFRRKMLSNPLLFILSADNLNQAFQRWLFLRKYDRMRRDQARAIAATRDMLSRKMAVLEDTRREKEALLSSMQDQKSTLDNELVQKDKLLKNLAKDENRLRSDLEKKQAAHEALNRMIENVIQEEIQRKTAEARKPAATTAPKPSSPANTAANAPAPAAEAPPAPTASEDQASVNFRRNYGKLPWPVENGFISRGYGRQKHPTLKNIEITNNGVDIRTEEGSSVRAVFDGEVAGVQFIPGHDYTVIIQHGDYYTVYSNLAETTLTKGQSVKSRQSIGKVSTNAITGASELHFELWYQKQRQNPAGLFR